MRSVLLREFGNYRTVPGLARSHSLGQDDRSSRSEGRLPAGSAHDPDQLSKGIGNRVTAYRVAVEGTVVLLQVRCGTSPARRRNADEADGVAILIGRGAPRPR